MFKLYVNQVLCVKCAYTQYMSKQYMKTWVGQKEFSEEKHEISS